MKWINKSMLICFSIAALSLPPTVFSSTSSQAKIATFAGGCFWCMQADYDKVPGVIKTVVGYTGGNVKNPSYKRVSAGGTGHLEAVKIFYDPKRVSYKKLLEIYWQNIDPTDDAGQFCDKGSSYRAAIFYHNKTQQQLSFSSKQKLSQSKRFPNIVTRIMPATQFYVAEKYHQKYYQKNQIRYYLYRKACGRDARLKKLWR